MTRFVRPWLVRRSVALAVLLGLAAMLSPSFGVAAQDEQEQRLSEAREKLEAIGEELTEAERAAETADEELADADRLLDEVEAVVNEVAIAVEEQEATVARAQQRLDAVAADQRELLDAFQSRATRMFKLGPTQALDLLLTGDNAGDAMARSSYLRVILEGDQVDLEALEAAEVAVTAERERADEERRRLAVLLEEQQEVLAEAEELRNSRALAAASARDRVERLAEERDDLESEQQEIEELIAEKQAEERRRKAQQRRTASVTSRGGGGAAPSATSSAGYAWPLCAPTTSEYGPRWGRMHRGIDLGAAHGRAIGATKAGTVISAGWQGGYGYLVLVDHGDGVVTASAHMSRMAVGSGQSVQRGQTIGYVGSTGNSTGPHLHLEFRVSGRAVNPRQYLSGRPC